MTAEYKPIESDPDVGNLYKNRTQEDLFAYEPMPLHIEDERNEWLRTLKITD